MGVRERLVELVRQSGMTQAEIARRVGEAPTWISNRLTGYSAIKADEVCRLATALGVPILAFFQDCESPDEMGELFHAAARVFKLTPEQVARGGFSMSVDEPPMTVGKPAKVAAPVEQLARDAAHRAVMQVEERLRAAGEEAARRAAEAAVAAVREQLGAELRAVATQVSEARAIWEMQAGRVEARAEEKQRELAAPAEGGRARPRGGERPSIAELWARGRVRQWQELSEAQQRRILEILEEPEEAPERGP